MLKIGDLPNAGRFRAEHPVLGKSPGLGKWAGSEVVKWRCSEKTMWGRSEAGKSRVDAGADGCHAAENRRIAENRTFSGRSSCVRPISCSGQVARQRGGEMGKEWGGCSHVVGTQTQLHERPTQEGRPTEVDRPSCAYATRTSARRSPRSSACGRCRRIRAQTRPRGRGTVKRRRR